MKPKEMRVTFRLSAEDYAKFEKLGQASYFKGWGRLIRTALEEFAERQEKEFPLEEKTKKTATPKTKKGK